MMNLKSLREQIYEYLRDEMYAGRIEPGVMLDLNGISGRLGVSKTPLRDALIKLEVEGFVTIMPRRGVMVNGLTLEDVRNFYEIIGALEAQVIKSAGYRITSDHISMLRQLNADMREALRRQAFDVYYQTNIEFHNIFLHLSDNAAIRPMIMPMKQRLYDFQRRPYVKEWELRNCREHDQFIDLIKTGDYTAAARIMQEVHWSFKVQEDFIREFYSRNARLAVQTEAFS